MELRKKQKRELILESTYEIFIEKGFVNTKIIDIAKRAGIGKGTVYEYFESKEAIFMALFDYFTDEYKKNYEDIKQVCQNKTASEQIKIFIKFESNVTYYMCHKKKLPPRLFVLELFKYSTLSDRFDEFLKYRYQCLLDIIINGIASGEFRNGDPSMISIGILGCIDYYAEFRNRRYIPPVFDDVSVDNWEMNDFLSLVLNGLQNNTRKEE